MFRRYAASFMCTVLPLSVLGIEMGEVCGIGKYKRLMYASPTTYSTAIAETPCTWCPEGKYNTGVSYTKTDCYDCGLGWFAPSPNGSCVQCPFGMTTTDLKCTTCPIGKSSQFYGKSVDLSHDAPTDDTSKWWEWCHSCPWMWAKSDPTALRCSRCSPGTASLQNRTGCSMCPAGTSNPGGDLSSCQKCQHGRYTSTPGNAACLNCPVGSTTNSWGGTSCVLCPAGKAGYAESASNPYCRHCSLPLYSHTTGLIGCQRCSAGSITNSSASSSCTVCPAGTWQKSSLNDVCVPCPSNPYGRASLVCPAYKQPLPAFVKLVIDVPLTVAEFTEDKQTLFVGAIAATASVAQNTFVDITGITSIVRRRRILSASIAVATQITTNTANANAVSGRLTPVEINRQMASFGMPAITVSVGATVETVKTVAMVNTRAQTPILCTGWPASVVAASQAALQKDALVEADTNALELFIKHQDHAIKPLDTQCLILFEAAKQALNASRENTSSAGRCVVGLLSPVLVLLLHMARRL